MVTVLLFVVAALVIGYSKTSLGGLAVVSVAIFASVLPARQSTAAILAVLLVGDLVAISTYRRDCDWGLVRELLPTVLPGLALGAAFLAVVDDTWLRRSIGVLLLALVLLQLSLNRRDRARPAPTVAGSPPPLPVAEPPPAPTGGGSPPPPADATAVRSSRSAGLAAGLGAGFATMTANAAGAVMTMFLVSKGVEKRRFVGTGAWFFFGVNLCKLPFSIGLGLMHWADLSRALLLAPAVVVGGWLGLHTMRRISQSGFEVAVLAASAVSALALIAR